MKSVLGYATKILFYLFVLAILVWSGSLTVSFVARVMPGDAIRPWFALAVFDGGALAWLLVFLFMAQGLGQRAVSLLMLAADLVGVGLMSFSELLMGGQTFTVPPAELGTIAVWAIGGFTFMNVVAAYAFHIMDPKQQEVIKKGVAMDKVIDKSLAALDAKLAAISDSVADELGQAMTEDALRSFGVKPRAAQAWNGRAESFNPRIAAGLGSSGLVIPGTSAANLPLPKSLALRKFQTVYLAKKGGTLQPVPNGHKPTDAGN